MIRAELKGSMIFLSADRESAIYIQRLRGAFRTSKMPPLTWALPLTYDAIDDLRREKVLVSPTLAQKARLMLAARKYVDEQKAADKVEPMCPIPIKTDYSLFNHQVKAFNIASALFGGLDESAQSTGGSCALFMDMGTGKSLTTVMIAGRLYLDGKIKRMLVVAPSSVCPVWPSEFRKFGAFPSRVAVLQGDKAKRLASLRYVQSPAMPGQQEPLRVAVINYESTWRLEAELKAFDADLIVCDESQRIKSHTAQQSKAMHRLGEKARYRMILTGTPIQNDTRDLWSQYKFLAPGVFPASYYAFEKRYALMGGYGSHQYLGPRNLEELTRKAHSIAYRVTKSECLDLPEKTFETREIALEDSAAALYQRIKKNAVAELEGGDSVTASIVLTQLLRLQQITGGFVTDDAGETKKVSSAKLDAVADIVQSLCVDEGKKLVIFTRFRAEMDGVCEVVQKVLGAKLQLVRIAGDVDISKRGPIVNQFQTDPDTRVFVGQIDACAEGITLTAADTVVYYIISETRNGVTTTYSYDALGQLIRVNDPVQNQTWVFNYDRGGNIVSRVRYAYTTGTLGTALETIPYTYGDSNWKDKLTAYNGKAITYDAIGNPLTFNGWTYQWQAGRQLKRMSAEGTALTFKYDHNGLRTQKVVEANWYPETTNYFLHGKLITHMNVEYYDWDEVKHTDSLHFFYDAQSRPAQVEFNGTVYTYVHNLQGDIVGLLDSTGALVVEYKYDAWGKPISTTGNLKDTLGKRNPFRYRGYVYDEETGLYYVNSRYFNPATGRFLNADGVFVNSLLGQNLFCYCWNNSSNHADSDGQIAFLVALGSAVIGAVTGAACSIACDLIAGEKVDWGSAGKEAAKGAVSAILPGGRVVSSIAMVAMNTADYLWECKTEQKEVEGAVIAWEVVATVAGEMIGAGLEGGAQVANKTVDKVVNEVVGVGIGTATSVVGKDVKTDAENKRKKNKSSTSSSASYSDSKMPYLVCVWNASIGKYEERVVYP